MNTNDFYNDNTPSRVRKNANLYKRIDASKIDEVELPKKEELLENNTSTIDVEKLKSMLDKKYRDLENDSRNTDSSVKESINLEETREYNLGMALNKARDNDDTDYKIERLKKLNDTNASILEGLNIKDTSTSKEIERPSKVSSDSKKLIELIDTINLKEQEGYDSILKSSNSDANINLEDEDTTGILDSLKGDNEETKVVGAASLDKDSKNLEDTKYEDIDLDDTKEEFDTTEVVNRDDTSEFTDSIELTTTQIFTKEDFDDFDDLKEATKPKILVKILIFIIIIAVILGTIFVLDRVLDLGILSRLGINF